MKQILIVDDQIDYQFLLGNFLRNLGFKVTAASGGFEAFTFFRERSFDLVISDLEMPLGDGLWLLRKLRTQSWNGKIIIVSGSLDVTSDQLKSEGASAFLQKPYDLNELLKELN